MYYEAAVNAFLQRQGVAIIPIQETFAFAAEGSSPSRVYMRSPFIALPTIQTVAGTLSVADVVSLFVHEVDYVSRLAAFGLLDFDHKAENTFWDAAQRKTYHTDLELVFSVSHYDAHRQRNRTFGTPRAMSLERMFCDPITFDSEAAFLLGILLSEAATGTYPFLIAPASSQSLSDQERMMETALRYARAFSQGPALEMLTILQRFPAPLPDIICSCLDFAPMDRPTLQELRVFADKFRNSA